jgi:hypothetical protein
MEKTMKLIMSLPAGAALGVTLLFAVEAAAQPSRPLTTTTTTTTDYTEQRTAATGDQIVTFIGDELPAPTNGPYGTTIRRPPGVTRVGLIRPRLNFVSELLKSVENL